MGRLRIRESLGGVLIVLGIILMVAANASAVGGPSFAFATIPEGKKALTEHDDFVSGLSAFDRSAIVSAISPRTPTRKRTAPD